MSERELDHAFSDFVAVNGDPGRVGSPARHFDKHRSEHLPELAVQFRVFQIEADDAAHAVPPELGNCLNLVCSRLGQGSQLAGKKSSPYERIKPGPADGKSG